MSTAEKSGRPERDQDLRCQSGPSAKDSVIFSGGDSSKNYGSRPTTTADFGSPLRQVPYTSNLCLLEERFKTEVCTCSQLPTEATQWIKEVELVDSVDELKSSSSIRGISMPNFEVLDARIASALNKKFRIPSSKGKSVWRNKKLRKRTVSFEVDRLPTLSTIISGSLEPMILSRTTPTCSPLFFEMTIFRNSILSGTEYYCL